MKIAFFDVKESWEKKQILKTLNNFEVKIFDKHIGDIDIKEFCDFDFVSIFVYSTIDENLLKKMKKLKGIFLRSTGFNNVDINYCKKNKISVFNVSHYGERTVAEFTFSHILNISRNFYNSINRVRGNSFNFRNLRGFDLTNKKITIIGFGCIGSHLAKMCLGFDMKVIAFVRDKKKYEEKYKNLNVEFCEDLDKCLKSDFITLHMPLNDKTKYFISKKEFSKMRKGTILINTSRGELVNTKDLLDALNKKIISFYGADVLEEEIYIKDELDLYKIDCSNENEKTILIEDHILLNHKNVFITPHNAFNTIDALKRILNTTLNNILDFQNKKENENKVV